MSAGTWAPLRAPGDSGAGAAAGAGIRGWLAHAAAAVVAAALSLVAGARVSDRRSLHTALYTSDPGGSELGIPHNLNPKPLIP